MRTLAVTLLTALSGGMLLPQTVAGAPADPYQWLEAIDDPHALAWVEKQNDATARRLAADPEYAGLYRDARAILDSSERLPAIEVHGGYFYNLWRDGEHPRGLYRRTTLEEFRAANPRWETVLDVDELARREGRPWVFAGAIWHAPAARRCLIQLSPGGGDAVEVREFDAEELEFVRGGFVLPPAKVRVGWRDADTIFVGTDFGAESLTASGYPRLVKLWQRGTPLSAAETLHEAATSSVAAFGHRLRSSSGDVDLVTELVTFWTQRHWQLLNGKLHSLRIPERASIIDAFAGRLVLWLKDDWTFAGHTHAAGSVVIADPAALRGRAHGRVDPIVTPSATDVVTAVNVTTEGLLVTMLENVRGRLYRFVPHRRGWERLPVVFPDHGRIAVVSVDERNGDAFVQFETFLTPPALFLLPAASTRPVELKAQPPSFDGSRFAVEQLWARSADGTNVPYFLVGPRELKRDGSNPVWMFSYGGFENALTPSYSGSYEPHYGAYGKLWLERGGVFVLANIRGGGEFGPRWHQAALKENRHRAFEDFEAIARDLVARKITVPGRIGIEGRSNGGLLVAATMLRHPELYGAVVCGVPLTDLQRYHRLLAGASWVDEYGNPEVASEWAYLSRYSPYQNVRAGMNLPPVMFFTSTRDDRVHPGHARKMAARMIALGYEVDYYENTEGGHRGSVTNEQLATRIARTFTFLWQHLR